MRWRAGLGAILAVAASLAATPARAQRWAIDDPGQGPVALAPGAAEAHELSGLAWLDGDRFVAVSDEDGALFRLHIAVDPRDGRIGAAAVESRLPLSGSSDLEGVALSADGTRVFVSDELGPEIREYRLADGQRLRTVAPPPPFKRLRYNLGFEALARTPDGSLWTANEDALKVDGPTTRRDDGAWVRLQRFDADLRPAGQFAYRLDAVGTELMIAGRGTGLSELVALPDGRLLALERSLGIGGLRIRLYEVDLDEARDVSGVANLSDAALRPASKRLLWERQSLRDNFEGAALGPPLADGSRSLVLVSDDGHALAQALYPLRLRPR
ncbi:MAG: esterase-like activity of phytase family protein [Deltaproteobacteria bacterium]|nr:esterase-like activity of phytase family protein [Deltaproteobacteria bacterium]